MKIKFHVIALLAILWIMGCKDDETIILNNCYSAGLNQGLIVSYSFENGSLANDISSVGNLINMNGAVPATDRMGNNNCAYQMNHSSDQHLISANPTFLNNLNSFSVSAWYQPIDSTRLPGDFEVLVGRNSIFGECPDRRGEWSLGLYDCRKAVFGHNNSVWENNPVPQPQSCEEIININTGTWKHIVAIYDNNSYKIYINGVLQETASGIAACGTQYVAQDIGDLFIGKLYTGKIDDILIYDRELTSQEVLELYGNAACCGK